MNDLSFVKDTNTIVPCIRCNKELERVIPTAVGNHAGGANSFRSVGQYGSGVFDPVDNISIEINLCDPCLVDVANTHVIEHSSSNIPT